MKIIAVGRNYAAHIEELNNEKPTEPVIFTKADSAILKDNAPFYHPSFSDDIHHEIEIVIKISKMGKSIDPAFAHNYFEEIALGIDFTARDKQAKLKEKGLPWDLAKGFDGSAPISNFFPKSEFNLSNLNFGLSNNGISVQEGNTSLMLYDFNFLISFISNYFTLKTGDLIFTGTPKGVAKVAIGDHLIGHMDGKEVLNFEVK